MLALPDQLPITVDYSGDDPVAVHSAARRHNLSAYQDSYPSLPNDVDYPSRPPTVQSPVQPASPAPGWRPTPDQLAIVPARGTGGQLEFNRERTGRRRTDSSSCDDQPQRRRLSIELLSIAVRRRSAGR